MSSKPVAFLLADLGVTKIHSRPHVSDDNPYSESQFRTMKYRPEFPDRFGCIQDSRAFAQGFFRGKGRKERCTPLTKQTRAVLKNWMNEPHNRRTEILFPNARGGRLSGDGVRYILAKQIRVASKTCPALLRKKVTPHVLRHYLPFLTMSSDIGQRSAEAHKIESQRGRTERITRHSLVHPTGC
jgi:integrase